MPSKTPKQARAMAAACHGKSTIGIPKKVACEFNKHDRGTGMFGKKSERSSFHDAGRSVRYKKGHGQ